MIVFYLCLLQEPRQWDVNDIFKFILPLLGSAGSTGHAADMRSSAIVLSYLCHYYVSAEPRKKKKGQAVTWRLKMVNEKWKNISVILCVRKRGWVFFWFTFSWGDNHKKVFVYALCKWQSTWQNVNCPYALNLNHMAGLNFGLPSELPSWQWQQCYRVSVHAFDPRCSRPGEHTGRARWPADQEEVTGRCRPGCLNHRQRAAIAECNEVRSYLSAIKKLVTVKVCSCESRHCWVQRYKSVVSWWDLIIPRKKQTYSIINA